MLYSSRWVSFNMAWTLGRKELEGGDGERKSVWQHAPTKYENLTTTALVTVSMVKLGYLVPSLPPLVPLNGQLFLTTAHWKSYCFLCKFLYSDIPLFPWLPLMVYSNWANCCSRALQNQGLQCDTIKIMYMLVYMLTSFPDSRVWTHKSLGTRLICGVCLSECPTSFRESVYHALGFQCLPEGSQ